jgi:hypothetical protein
MLGFMTYLGRKQTGSQTVQDSVERGSVNGEQARGTAVGV